MTSTTVLSGQFTGVDVSADTSLTKRKYNVSVFGTFSATMEVQRSFDQGVTWLTVKSITAPYEGLGIEVGDHVHYRMACTQFTSGTVNYRLDPSTF